MSVDTRATIEVQESEASAPVRILFNLPPELQNTTVLRALICAEEAGYQRRAHDETAAALSQIRLSAPLSLVR